MLMTVVYMTVTFHLSFRLSCLIFLILTNYSNICDSVMHVVLSSVIYQISTGLISSYFCISISSPNRF